MLTLIIENKNKEQLNLSNNPDYKLLQVTGLTPPNATINTSVIATKDGSVYNSSRLENRNITILIAPRRNIEKTRINIYKYIKSKQYIKLYIKNGLRDVWIEGYVENLDGDLYENPQKLQVSIICPDPYFKSFDILTSQFSNIESLFEFPFAIDAIGVPISELSLYSEKNIYNPSDNECGAIIELYARAGTVLEPTLYNLTTGQSFTIQYEMIEGDKIILNTRTGEKSLTLVRDGVESNIINHMLRGSNWIKLQDGDNLFSYTCVQGADNLQVTITLQPIYEGV